MHYIISMLKGPFTVLWPQYDINAHLTPINIVQIMTCSSFVVSNQSLFNYIERLYLFTIFTRIPKCLQALTQGYHYWVPLSLLAKMLYPQSTMTDWQSSILFLNSLPQDSNSSLTCLLLFTCFQSHCVIYIRSILSMWAISRKRGNAMRGYQVTRQTALKMGPRGLECKQLCLEHLRFHVYSFVQCAVSPGIHQLY